MILGAESFDQAKQMIESSDHGDKIVVFEVLEQSDFLENMVYILILYKEANVTRRIWDEYAPKTMKKIRSLGVGESSTPLHLNMRLILDLVVKYNVSERQMNFLLSKYADLLSSYLPSKFKITITLHERTES